MSVNTTLSSRTMWTFDNAFTLESLNSWLGGYADYDSSDPKGAGNAKEISSSSPPLPSFLDLSSLIKLYLHHADFAGGVSTIPSLNASTTSKLIPSTPPPSSSPA